MMSPNNLLGLLSYLGGMFFLFWQGTGRFGPHEALSTERLILILAAVVCIMATFVLLGLGRLEQVIRSSMRDKAADTTGQAGANQ
jgi:hypothetical protein